MTLSGPLAGKTLPVFWMEGYAGGLFLPFRDATSGAETYAAGRYLLDTVKGADQGGDFERARADARLQPRLSPIVHLRPKVELPAGATRGAPRPPRAGWSAGRSGCCARRGTSDPRNDSSVVRMHHRA